MRIVGAGLVGLILFAAPASGDLANTLGVIKANQQIASLWWEHLKPMAESAVTDALEAQVGQTFTTGGTTITVLDLVSTQYWFQIPPGFQKLTMQEIRLRFPLAGFWAAKVKFKVQVTQTFWLFSFTQTFDLTAIALNVWAKAHVFIDSSDPEAPVIASVPPPDVNANVVFWTNQWWLNLVVPFVTPMVNNAIEDGIAEAIEGVAPILDAVAGLPGTPFGSGGPALTDSGAPTDFETPALHISDKIQQYHLPYGTLVEAIFSNPYGGTWEQSIADSAFDPGVVTGYGGWGDSAIWSGHYLMAEAYRYAATGDPGAVENALNVLAGIDAITQMKGVDGWLNRSVRPADLYPVGPDSEDFVYDWNGTSYVMSNFISRDQYMGVFMGLSAAYDFIDDPTVQQMAQVNIERMLDYLLENDWVAYRIDGSISTVWHFNYAQMCAWVRAGFRVNPAKYAVDLAQHIWLEDLVWVAPWLETNDAVINSYYKFNLQHGAFATLLRLETIPYFWNRVWKGFRIMRHALAHHQNAHFNMCEISAMPSLAGGPMGGETRELLRRWLQHYRRDIGPDTLNDPAIATVLYEPLSLGTILGEGELWDSPTAELVAAQPLPPNLRRPTDFMWQRSPFGLGSGGGNPHAESPGVDYILPYWMGRYYDVFPN